MMRLRFLSAIVFAVIFTAAAAQAQEQTTGNIVGNGWSGVVPYSGTGAGFSGGNAPGYNSSNNTIYFGYTQSTVAQTIAINQALQGSGILVNGYNWSWTISNGTASTPGNLTANINTFSNTGSLLHNFTQSYSGVINNQTFNGSQTYTNPYQLGNLGNLSVEFSGKDGSFWAGYYGPEVSNVNISLRYAPDPCVVNPQSSPSCPGYKTYYNMTDDGWAQVNLPFAFPFYGQTFTTSYMYTNGVIGFLNPNWGGYCCDGTDLNQERFVPNSPWNFAIYALNTDLYPGPNSQFYTERTNNGNGLRYHWDRVVELGTANENTFNVELRNTGYIGINYQQVNLSPWRNPLIGIAGDINQNQYSQYYFGPASNLPNLAGSTLNYSGTELTDICAINPLYNPSCPGYQQAYFTQQCSINALYDPTCPGYAAAYLTYQCNIDQLYSPSCPGYQQAYLDQQCGINPLYATSCANYQTASAQCSADPFTATYCPDFQTAVSDCSANGLLHTYCPTYQTELNYCSVDPLFNNLCPAYQTATASCAANSLNHSYCPGYTTALNTCASNPLSNTLCSGYTSASNACSANQLTYTFCPSYTTAISACSTNPQSNTMCPGYSSTASSGSGGSSTAATSTTSPTVQVASDGKVSTELAVVADSAVNSVITERATSTAPNPTATVSLAPQPTAATETVKAAAVEQKKEDRKEDTKTADNNKDEKKDETKSADSKESSTTTASASNEQKKDQPKTARQEIQERRVAAAREKAVEAGKELAGKMGEAASLEAQVAVQNVVIQAMGFTPGFDAYGKVILPDAQGYRPFEIYPGQRVIDNPQGRRFMTGSDRLHQDMVDQQYTRSE